MAQFSDDEDTLLNSLDAHCDILLTEYKQAGVMPNGFYDMAFNEEMRRMIWAGQSPDGRKWDDFMPEGMEAKPWNGSSDTRVPLVDGVCNDMVDILTAAFRKADLRATTVNPDNQELASGVSDYLYWMVHTRYKKALRLEAELAAQYAHEYGFSIAYVGWERELGKRRVTLQLGTLQQLAQQAQPNPDGTPNQMASLPSMIADPEQDEASAEMLRSLYRMFVQQQMQKGGFYDQEAQAQTDMDLKLSKAKKYVRELRETGSADVPVPYVVRNEPTVWVCKPYQDVLAARGTMMLQQARAIFWRRWMTEAELEAKRVDGWNGDWIDLVKETKGNISSWAGALGATSLTGPSTKTVGNTTYLKITEENNPLIEVVYAFVKKVDEDGVTGVYETIFSPHILDDPKSRDTAVRGEFYAKHELNNSAHGRYPFVEFKRESIGRALTDCRSVPEIAGTWQSEQKKQRDMLFNRADWDTLPPVKVPKLGGVDYKLGPGAQVALSKAQDISAINMGAPAPTLSMDLVNLVKLQAAEYFGQFNKDVHPAKLAIHQEKLGDDFYTFWNEVLMMMFSLTLQYNPDEIVRVTGNQALAQLDPFTVMEDVMLALEFDLKDLNPDYLLQKLDIINNKILPGDAAGVLDRGGLTAYQAKAVDPQLAKQFIQDQRGASQKMYDDVQNQVSQMMLGFEAKYVDNDPTAQTKLQYLQTLAGNNPKVKQWYQSDARFKALMENYQKNLQMSVEQQQNKQIGRIGVKPVGTGGPGGSPGGAPPMQQTVNVNPGPMPGNGQPSPNPGAPPGTGVF